MTRLWGSCLFLLTLLVALVASTNSGRDNKVPVLRELKLISASNSNVKQCLWHAMQEYNKQSEDKYIFKAVKIVQVQLQVTDRLEYFMVVKIARSDCRKLAKNSENCVVQGNSKLKKEITCNFIVGALPWNGEFTVMKMQCADT
ncbi:PREDICTED: cystatin-8 [Miniopterus natalensis]|uniref:cystatin-8 n=1 Tax=Miniopterus natalensis TaxID=291302 RepID=UPI0007A6A71B|nr:PREDICTED: cystatin-8 [Miniopterus natalensis]